ncbi:MAG: cytochrome c1 [Rhodospirillales bacterium]|nr:cytochrome c1 [Rhodospirillales bacterium]
MTRLRTIARGMAATLAVILLANPALAAGGVEAPRQQWGFNGIFGTFDRGALQRGWQVYREVCASCHSLEFIAFRNLEGIGLTPEQVAAIAGEFEVQAGPNDEGEMYMRRAIPPDRLPKPFPNAAAARVANNGALPPDLSLIVEARPFGMESFYKPTGADYVYALLTGYHEPPEGFVLGAGMYYNEYFPGHQIAMPPILNDGGVTYVDGTEATQSQQARDVVTFLTWAAEPNLEERRQMGVGVTLFLIVLTAFLYATKRKIWADAH